MCNEYEQQAIAWRQYCDMMDEIEWRITAGQSERDLPSKPQSPICCDLCRRDR